LARPAREPVLELVPVPTWPLAVRALAQRAQPVMVALAWALALLMGGDHPTGRRVRDRSSRGCGR
jgi:hypothetical protein